MNVGECQGNSEKVREVFSFVMEMYYRIIFVFWICMRCIMTSTTSPIHAVGSSWEYGVGNGSAYRHAMEGGTTNGSFPRGRAYYTHFGEILKGLPTRLSGWVTTLCDVLWTMAYDASSESNDI